MRLVVRLVVALTLKVIFTARAAASVSRTCLSTRPGRNWSGSTLSRRRRWPGSRLISTDTSRRTMT